MASSEPLPDQQRIKLLDLLYAFSTCPDDEKAEARKALEQAIDVCRMGKGITRQEVIDYLRHFHFRDYYRARKRQERGEV